MITNQQPEKFGTASGVIEPEMESLLQMTNAVVMKIKQRTQEMYN